MKERPILVATIGYIIGILWGLYLKTGIIPFYILIFAIYNILKFIKNFKHQKRFKLISFSRYSRYIKLIINKKAILILIIFSVISNVIINFQEKRYEKYEDGENLQITGIVKSKKIEKQYYDLYKINNFYVQIEKNKVELEYGDKVVINGEYQKPDKQRNFGGYDDSTYLKTQKIY